MYVTFEPVDGISIFKSLNGLIFGQEASQPGGNGILGSLAAVSSTCVFLQEDSSLAKLAHHPSGVLDERPLRCDHSSGLPGDLKPVGYLKVAQGPLLPCTTF